MTPAGKPVWGSSRMLSFIQFPWRLFLVLSFTSSFVIAGIIYHFPQRWRWIGAAAGIVLVLACHARYARPYGELYQEKITDLKTWVYEHHPMDSMDVVPRNVKLISAVPPAALVKVISGEAAIDPLPARPAPRYSFAVHSPKGAVLMMYHYYFPGWRVILDGKEASVSGDNPYGIMVFAVPPGDHRIKIFFGHTPVRWAGEIISLAALLGLAGVWAGFRILHRKTDLSQSFRISPEQSS